MVTRLEILLEDWDKEQRTSSDRIHNFEKGYEKAVQRVQNEQITQKDLDKLLRRIPKRWIPNDPFFKYYGLFISAAANRLIELQPDTPTIVRISSIRENFKNEVRGWWNTFKNKATLDYLGFRQSKGTCIYDEEARDTFGAYASGDALIILNGDAGNKAGWRQQGGEIFVFGNARNRVNEEQAGGSLSVAGNAKDSANIKKTYGTTYINGSAGRYGAKKMTGGKIFVKGNIGSCWAEQCDGEVYAGSGAGRLTVQALRKIKFQELDNPASELQTKSLAELNRLGINPHKI